MSFIRKKYNNNNSSELGNLLSHKYGFDDK
jgi:hypothetical protein